MGKIIFCLHSLFCCSQQFTQRREIRFSLHVYSKMVNISVLVLNLLLLLKDTDAFFVGQENGSRMLQRRASSSVAPCQYSSFRRSKLNNLLPLNAIGDNQESKEVNNSSRRDIWKQVYKIAYPAFAGVALASITRPVWATSKSRTEGYGVQKSEEEWRKQLSSIQYNILREGGTEPPFYSILESEKRPGIFKCVACGTPLFDSKDKFNSGTGWPSFARGLDGVEVEDVNPVIATLGGAELRCKTCGGHLGDVFSDGKIFVGTEAFVTGKRFCIDGVALSFEPENGDEAVRGDIPAKTRA